jgi:hypothetical protein
MSGPNAAHAMPRERDELPLSQELDAPAAAEPADKYPGITLALSYIGPHLDNVIMANSHCSKHASTISST